MPFERKMARELEGWGGPSDDPGKERGKDGALGSQSLGQQPGAKF